MPETRSWSHAERALELPRLMDIVAGFCEIDTGKAELQSQRPSFDKFLIEKRLRETQEAVDLLSQGEIPIYSNARDVSEQVRASGKGSLVPGEHLYRIGETLGAMSRLRKFVFAVKEKCPTIWFYADSLAYLPDLQKELHEAIGPDGEVLDSASPQLKSLRAKKNTQARKITEKIQSLVGGALKGFLQEPIYTQREGRYVVPVKAQYKGKVPGIVHDASGSGQTIFVEPEVIVGEMNKLREIEAAENEEVERILSDLSKKVGANSESILAGLSAIAILDAVFSKARYAFSVSGNKPEILDGNFIRIVEGHHPLIERADSVPLTVSVGGTYKSLLITGPNTGGKTVCLKTIGLYCLMSGAGLFPPARRVELGPFTSVWADIGDEQSLQQSLSTFSGHLKNIARVFQNAKAGALALFDEIGAGTDPREGAALGKAIITKLLERGVTIAASTHYGELKEFALTNDNLASAAMEFDLKTLRPTYHLIPGASGASHAFEISRRHGMPADVITEAEGFIGSEAKYERQKSAQLDQLLASAREEKAMAETLRKEAQAQAQLLERERTEAKEKLAKARERGEETLAEVIRESREQYRALLEALNEKQSALSGSEREQFLQQAKSIENELRKISTGRPTPDVEYHELKEGMDVTVRGHPHIGKIVSIQKSGAVVVQVNNLKLTANRNDVAPARAAQTKSSARKNRPSLSRAESVSQELQIRKMNVEEAKDELERFFDDAALAGLHQARIVHGKGDGILRRVVREFLSARKDVKSFAEATPQLGGSGVTLVEFKS